MLRTFREFLKNISKWNI